MRSRNIAQWPSSIRRWPRRRRASRELRRAAALNEQLELYLTQPERLFSQPVRAAARDTLARAGEHRQSRSGAAEAVATLKDWMRALTCRCRSRCSRTMSPKSPSIASASWARSPSARSDLVPGSYTVVGTRPGYRDVRREINVRPGAAAEPVVIRCEDRI